LKELLPIRIEPQPEPKRWKEWPLKSADYIF